MEKDTEKKDRFGDIEKIAEYQRKQQENKKTVIVEFPAWFIAAVLLFIALRYFGNELLTIAVFLFLGFVLMSAFKPIAKWFQERNIPKGISIAFTYILVLGIIAGLASVIFVPFGKEIQDMAKELPGLLESFLNDFHGINIGSFSIDKSWFTGLTDNLSSFLTPSGSFESIQSIASTVGGVINWVAFVVGVIILSIYLLSDSDQLLELGLLRIANDRKRERVKKLIEDVEKKLGRWLIGQTVISTTAGTVLGLSLSLLNIPFALPLAVLAGFLDMIPSIGATLAIIPAVLVALISGGISKALILAVIFIIFQQIENNFLIPKIMGTAVGLKPIFVMLGVFIFLILFGVWGAALAVPVIVVGEIFYDFFIDLQKLEAEGIV
jgi:predicted PurR-regulated permease PerM